MRKTPPLNCEHLIGNGGELGKSGFDRPSQGAGSLDQGDFQGLGNLQILYLSRNAITDLDPGDFQGLDNLTWLLIEETSLTNLEPGDFQGLGNLQSLNLYGSRVTSVEFGDFQGLDKVARIDLKRNLIAKIEQGAFAGIDSLEELILGGNPLVGVGDGAFQGLDQLRLLDLSESDFNELNLTNASFGALHRLDVDNLEILSLILDRSVLSEGAFQTIIDATRFISNASLLDLKFSDAGPAGLGSLLRIPTLENVRVDWRLYDRYAAEFKVFDAIDGRTVTIVPEPSAFFLVVGTSLLARMCRRRRVVDSA